VERSAENGSVALEDRDWYREEPSKEWNRMRAERVRRYGGPPANAARSGSERANVRWLACVAFVLAVGGAGYWFQPIRATVTDLLDRQQSAATATPPAQVIQTARPAPPSSTPTQASALVRLGTRPELDVPAKVVGRWTLNDPRFGTITLYVPVGRTPREAITVALAERGYQVVG
jgi:hypothetical protein